jgi:hypothetical protein
MTSSSTELRVVAAHLNSFRYNNNNLEWKKNRFRDSAVQQEGENLHLEVFNVCRMIISKWMISPVLRKCPSCRLSTSLRISRVSTTFRWTNKRETLFYYRFCLSLFCSTHSTFSSKWWTDRPSNITCGCCNPPSQLTKFKISPEINRRRYVNASVSSF